MSDVLEEMDGGAELCAWFGGVPVFADSPVVAFSLSIEPVASLTLKVFPLGSEGDFRADEASDVTFEFDAILAVNLVDLAPGSVVATLSISRSEQGYVMEIEAAFGLHGAIEAKSMAVRFVRHETPEAP